MTISSFVINAKVRTIKGKHNCKKLRRKESVPSIIYGYGNDAVSILFDKKELLNLSNEYSKNIKIFQLELAGDVFYVLLKHIQLHPCNNNVLHIDFQRVKNDDFINIEVPFEFIGMETSIGIKSGGVLFKQMTSLNIRTMVKDIPNSLKVDISLLNVNDSIYISDLKMDNKVAIPMQKNSFKKDYLIASILSSRVTTEVKT